LHEIFGLSSATGQTTTVPDDDNQAAHTYPPTVQAPAEDEPSSECLVCLSSPREVVLLPCRHLVACKECAINMIEFGAGGAIMHTEEPTTTTEPQPTEITEPPSADDTVPQVVVTDAAEEDASALEGQADNTDSPAVEPSPTTAQPVEGGDTATATPSAPAPATSTTPVPSSAANGTQTAPVPQNPRRRRRAKGWSCPVCRQRKRS
jgi:Zinc finger, C3HC4 type (RING finger)